MQRLPHIAIFAIACMCVGLLCSRALLSIGMLLFIVTAILVYCKQPVPVSKQHRLLIIALAALFLLPFISGLWSSNLQEWWSRCQVKLPLLLLPAALLFTRFTDIQVFGINLLLVFCVVMGTAYSLFEYLLQPQLTEAGYNTARVMPTPLNRDHIRFSWWVVIAIILLLQMQGGLHRTKHRVINGLLIAWLVVYLHILSAKTGLLMLYTIAPIYIIWLARTTGRRWLWGLLAGICLLPVIAYQTIPTFKKRVDYARYDFSFYAKGQHREGLSDAVRVISIQAGWQLWQNNLPAGVGYGDIRPLTEDWYRQHKPALQPYEQILPGSQLLLYAAGCGIAGILALLWALLLPLVQAIKGRHIYSILFMAATLPSFLYEIPLESQYGVFIFCFFVCWFSRPTKSPSTSS